MRALGALVSAQRYGCGLQPRLRTILHRAHGCLPCASIQVLVRGGDNSEAGADAPDAHRAATDTEADSMAGGAEKAKGIAKFVLAATVYPSNNSDVQVFELPAGTRAHTLKLLFIDSTDMFGRIVVYLLDVLGT